MYIYIYIHIYIYIYIHCRDDIVVKQEWSMNTRQYNTRYWNNKNFFHQMNE